jgi:sugar lactone lactonase YvrE
MSVFGSSKKLLMARAGAVPVDRSWDIAYASYSGTSFSVTGQEDTPTGLFFKPDGLGMFIVGSADDEVNQYSLSTAWDVSTASFVQSFNVSFQDAFPQALSFKDDGTKMYVLGDSGNDVNEYNLSAAWDISTASYSQNFVVGAQETNPQGLFFTPDGSGFYVTGSSSDSVHQYSLSAAWDVSTASFVQSFSVSAQESQPQGVFFKDDGSIMYILGSSGDDVNQYNLSTVWDISTASYSKNFSVSSQDVFPRDLFFRGDGSQMFIIGDTNNTVYAYDIG